MTSLAVFLAEHRATVVDRADLLLRETPGRHYGSLEPEVRRKRLETLYEQLLDAAASHDLGRALDYGRELAQERFSAGYDLSEIQVAINTLEEATWAQIFATVPPAELADALGGVSTILGATKDALAREYVSLSTRAHAPSLDLRALFTGGAGA